MKHFSRVVLSGVCVDSAHNSQRGGGKVFAMDRFLATAYATGSSRRVDRCLVECHGDLVPQGFASLELIRQGLQVIADGGKEVFFFAENYGPVQLYLSQAATGRYMNPCGIVTLNGLHRVFSFYKEFFSKYGVEFEIFRRGEYKSAHDRLRVGNLDDANREQWQRFYDSVREELHQVLSDGTPEAETLWEELLGGALLSADTALARSWITGCSTLSELLDDWKVGKLKEKKLHRSKGFGKGRKVAVFHMEGAIVEGTSRWLPPLGRVMGSSSVVKELGKLEKSKSVGGVVLWINSVGGSAAASHEISTGIARLAKKKPVVTALSEIAASGGYWIALGGSRIFAHNTTLTGSIGVIVLSACWKGLMTRLGINQETLGTHPSADFGSVARPPSDGEREQLDQFVEAIYQRFITRVSDGRSLSREEVEELARGRVWVGRDAVERRLIDGVGGLNAALDHLREELGEESLKVRYYPRHKVSFVQKQLSKMELSTSTRHSLAHLLYGGIGDLNMKPLAMMEEALLSSLEREAAGLLGSLNQSMR